MLKIKGYVGVVIAFTSNGMPADFFQQKTAFNCACAFATALPLEKSKEKVDMHGFFLPLFAKLE